MTTSLSSGPSLGRRLTAAFAATLCIALAGSAYGAWALNRAAEQTADLVGQSVTTERLVADWYRNVVASVRRTTAIAVSSDPSLADFFKDEAATTTKSTSDVQEKISKLMNTPEEKALFDEIGQIRKGYVEHRDAVFTTIFSGLPTGTSRRKW